MKKTDDHDFLNFLNRTYGTKDSDGDGICDEVELMIGTDPYQADTDGDGMNDGDEIKAGRNPLGPGDFKSFHDFFMPHEGNDYRPQALHPKRLLFYVISATAIKILLVAFVIGLPVTAWLSPDVMIEQTNRIIKLTNDIRSGLSLAPLVENKNLTMAAYDKAQDMLISQYFAHTGPDGHSLRDWLNKVGYQYQTAGENLAMGFATPDEVVTAWTKSPTHYANLIDSDFNEIGVGMISGAYHGEETTLVAQYFGQPKFVSELRATVAAQPGLRPALAKKTVAQSPVVSVKAVKQSLAEPEIIEPSSGLTTAKGDVLLVVKAPGAERVLIKAGDKILGQAGKPKSQPYGRVAVQLPEGGYNLSAVAELGALEKVSRPITVTIDRTAPTADMAQAKVWLENLPNSQDQLLKIQAPVDKSAVSAQVAFADNFINLRRIEGSDNWSGQAVIYHNQNQAQTLVPPILTVKDAAGNSNSYDLPIRNIKPSAGSWTEKYFFLKNNPNRLVSQMFDVSSVFYKILIIITGLALALAVINERKRQTKQTVATTAIFAIFILFLLMV